MKTYNVEVRDGAIHCPDFPDAAKLVVLPNDMGKELAHLSLHLVDLHFAEECLDELSRLEADGGAPDITQRALWNVALVSAFKCFGDSRARERSKPDDIYEPGEQREAFEYYKCLRDKHIAHDDNDWSQAHTGAVLAQPGVEPQVPEILCFSLQGSNVGGPYMAGLRAAIGTARQWVERPDQSSSPVSSRSRAAKRRTPSR